MAVRSAGFPDDDRSPLLHLTVRRPGGTLRSVIPHKLEVSMYSLFAKQVKQSKKPDVWSG